MREAFPEALITLPGKSYTNSDLAGRHLCRPDSRTA